VLHTDVRDVLFQLDPFEEIEAYGGGVFFLESNDTVIGKSYTNRMWMTRNCSVYHTEGVLSQVCAEVPMPGPTSFHVAFSSHGLLHTNNPPREIQK
jgi:hypothetical protein